MATEVAPTPPSPKAPLTPSRVVAGAGSVGVSVAQKSFSKDNPTTQMMMKSLENQKEEPLSNKEKLEENLPEGQTGTIFSTLFDDGDTDTDTCTTGTDGFEAALRDFERTNKERKDNEMTNNHRHLVDNVGSTFDEEDPTVSETGHPSLELEEEDDDDDDDDNFSYSDEESYLSDEDDELNLHYRSGCRGKDDFLDQTGAVVERLYKRISSASEAYHQRLRCRSNKNDADDENQPHKDNSKVSDKKVSFLRRLQQHVVKNQHPLPQDDEQTRESSATASTGETTEPCDNSEASFLEQSAFDAAKCNAGCGGLLTKKELAQLFPKLVVNHKKKGGRNNNKAGGCESTDELENAFSKEASICATKSKEENSDFLESAMDKARQLQETAPAKQISSWLHDTKARVEGNSEQKEETAVTSTNTSKKIPLAPDGAESLLDGLQVLDNEEVKENSPKDEGVAAKASAAAPNDVIQLGPDDEISVVAASEITIEVSIEPQEKASTDVATDIAPDVAPAPAVASASTGQDEGVEGKNPTINTFEDEVKSDVAILDSLSACGASIADKKALFNCGHESQLMNCMDERTSNEQDASPPLDCKTIDSAQMQAESKNLANIARTTPVQTKPTSIQRVQKFTETKEEIDLDEESPILQKSTFNADKSTTPSVQTLDESIPYFVKKSIERAERLLSESSYGPCRSEKTAEPDIKLFETPLQASFKDAGMILSATNHSPRVLAQLQDNEAKYIGIRPELTSADNSNDQQLRDHRGNVVADHRGVTIEATKAEKGCETSATGSFQKQALPKTKPEQKKRSFWKSRYSKTEKAARNKQKAVASSVISIQNDDIEVTTTASKSKKSSKKKPSTKNTRLKKRSTKKRDVVESTAAHVQLSSSENGHAIVEC